MPDAQEPERHTEDPALKTIKSLMGSQSVGIVVDDSTLKKMVPGSNPPQVLAEWLKSHGVSIGDTKDGRKICFHSGSSEVSGPSKKFLAAAESLLKVAASPTPNPDVEQRRAGVVLPSDFEKLVAARKAAQGDAAPNPLIEQLKTSGALVRNKGVATGTRLLQIVMTDKESAEALSTKLKEIGKGAVENSGIRARNSNSQGNAWVVQMSMDEAKTLGIVTSEEPPSTTINPDKRFSFKAYGASPAPVASPAPEKPVSPVPSPNPAKPAAERAMTLSLGRLTALSMGTHYNLNIAVTKEGTVSEITLVDVNEPKKSIKITHDISKQPLEIARATSADQHGKVIGGKLYINHEQISGRHGTLSRTPDGKVTLSQGI